MQCVCRADGCFDGACFLVLPVLRGFACRICAGLECVSAGRLLIAQVLESTLQNRQCVRLLVGARCVWLALPVLVKSVSRTGIGCKTVLYPVSSRLLRRRLIPGCIVCSKCPVSSGA